MWKATENLISELIIIIIIIIIIIHWIIQTKEANKFISMHNILRRTNNLRQNKFVAINHIVYLNIFFNLVLWHINNLRLFNAKSIFKYTNSSISNNSVYHILVTAWLLLWTIWKLLGFKQSLFQFWDEEHWILKYTYLQSLSLYMHTYSGSDLMKKIWKIRKYSLWGKERELPPGNSALRDLERPEKWTTM